MSLSIAEILEEYRLARDALVAGIRAGESVVELEIRNRRVRYSDPASDLKTVEAQITHYESRLAASQSRSQRNYARLAR